MSRDRRLGRGLAALLGNSPDDVFDPDAIALTGDAGFEADASSANGDHPVRANAGADAGESGREVLLSVEMIELNPFQPRRDFGEAEIASLAESLKDHDMLQPVLVRPSGDRWQLISGERRLRAAIRAGWKKIPARVREADDRLVAELAIVENLQRKDLNPLEKALSFQRYLQEHGSTQEELGKRLKIDRSTIANLMRLLELPDAVQNALRQGRITAGHARALLPLGDEKRQIEFAEKISGDGLSVREIERLVQEHIQREDGGGLSVVGAEKVGRQRARRGSSQVASLEQELRRALGARIDIQANARGRGKIVIHFKSHEEFQRLRQCLVDDRLATSQSEVG